MKWHKMHFPPILGNYIFLKGLKQAGTCHDYQLRHSGVVLRIEMLLLESHSMKTAADGPLAKAVERIWMMSRKCQACGWRKGQMRR